MPATPSFAILFITQVLGAGGEAFGQRCSRILYKRSNVRLLAAVTVYSCLQAVVLLGIAEYTLPRSWTGGQGAISMWASIWEHPGLLLNALTNTFYWAAQVYVLREPLGVILVVLAFVLSSFLIKPFSIIAGLGDTTGTIGAHAIVAGVVGAILCLIELPAGKAWRVVQTVCPSCHDAVRTFWLRMLRMSPDDVARRNDRFVSLPGAGAHASRSHTTTSTADDDDGGASGGGSAGSPPPDADDDVRGVAREDVALVAPDGVRLDIGSRTPVTTDAGTSTLGVVIAWVTLVVTAGIGIVITKYFEDVGISNFGYAAVDQVLLPFSTLPLLLLAVNSPRLSVILGEPRSQAKRNTSFWAMLKLTWAETQLTALIPFRLLMLCREFLFFYLATSFNLAPTYLQMTLLRVVLSWVASVLACTFLRRAVGVEPHEAWTTMAPPNFTLKLLGSGLELYAVVALHNSQG